MQAIAKTVGVACIAVVGCASHTAVGSQPRVPHVAAPSVAAAVTADTTTDAVLSDESDEPRGGACPPIDTTKLEPPACNDAIASVPIPGIVDPKGSLTHFHERMIGLARGTVTDRVRVAVYGDSNAQADMMTGHMRRVLQGRFGDGGHGFVVLGHPKGFYGHENVRRGGTWAAFTNFQVSNDLVADGHYGFANIASEARGWGARAWVATAKEGPVGTRAGRFEIFFFRRPGGGSFDVLADGKLVKTISTRADAFEAGFEQVVLDDGPHELLYVSRGGGPVRFAGVALERDVPGVVIDALGTGALNITQMTWVKSSTRRPMLERRGYDLVVIHLGTAQGELSLHKVWAKSVVDDLRAALPNASFLFLTPPDALIDHFGAVSDPRIITVSQQIREIASETGAAFWDYRAAMGGDASMRTFLRQKLAWTDAVHLSHKGHELMGDRLLHALLEDNARFRREHPDALCR